MRSENAIMPSRREFLSDALGIGLVTTSTWSIRDGEGHSMYGQSDRSAASSGRAIKNTSLTWAVFLAPSIRAIAPDVPPGETARPWPPISSTLISGERDAVLVDTIGLIVAGDAAYNGDHLHLSESPDQQKRQEWIAALDTMESLEPRAVVAGHKRVGNDDSPRIIEETRKYIRDFERLVMQTTTARELYDEMLRLYPDWINRGALWSSVLAVKTSV